MDVDDTGVGVVSKEDDRGECDCDRKRPFEEVWLRGDGAIAFKIIDSEFEVGFCVEIMATQIFDEIIDADFVVGFEDDFHMMTAGGLAKFFRLDARNAAAIIAQEEQNDEKDQEQNHKTINQPTVKV